MEDQPLDQQTIIQRQKQYDDIIEHLMKNGFTRRNAKRYVISQQKKIIRKFLKRAKKNAALPKQKIEISEEID